MILKFRNDLDEKDVQISELGKLLEEKNLLVDEYGEKIDMLITESKKMNDIIEKQTMELNTAYYVFGNEKELKENNIISKEGGFIGLGKMAMLMENFNKEYFTKIDIRNIDTIDIESKKAKIITPHPSGSYELTGKNKKVDKLIISNLDEFWGTSRYLIILVD